VKGGGSREVNGKREKNDDVLGGGGETYGRIVLHGVFYFISQGLVRGERTGGGKGGGSKLDKKKC